MEGEGGKREGGEEWGEGEHRGQEGEEFHPIFCSSWCGLSASCWTAVVGVVMMKVDHRRSEALLNRCDR